MGGVDRAHAHLAIRSPVRETMMSVREILLLS